MNTKVKREFLQMAWLATTLTGLTLGIVPIALMYVEARQPGTLDMPWMPSGLPMPAWFVKGAIASAPAIALSLGFAMLRNSISERLRHLL